MHIVIKSFSHWFFLFPFVFEWVNAFFVLIKKFSAVKLFLDFLSLFRLSHCIGEGEIRVSCFLSSYNSCFSVKCATLIFQAYGRQQTWLGLLLLLGMLIAALLIVVLRGCLGLRVGWMDGQQLCLWWLVNELASEHCWDWHH